MLLLLAAADLDILDAVPIVVHASAMLYVTVAAAALAQLNVDGTELVERTPGGGLYIAGIVEAVK